MSSATPATPDKIVLTIEPSFEQRIEHLLWEIDDRSASIPIPGWFGEDNRRELDRLIRKHDVQTVVEIGSFLGLSAVWFAQHKRIQSVTCVDRWIEDAEYESENNLVGTLRRWNWPRDFFPMFAENIARSGYWHKIHPIRGHSHYVSGQVPDCDLIYIDAGHEYSQVRRDIEIYREKARVILCGDDYMKREGFGVIEAVTKLLPKHQHSGPFWWFEQP